MPLGLATQFNILEESPHDRVAGSCKAIESDSLEGSGRERWVPSRYNVRATTDDGRLVLWNTYRGSLNVFEAGQRSAIEALLSRKGFEAQCEGIVEYLVDRGFLLREGTNEYQRVQMVFGRHQFRTDVLQLTLLASEDCNFRCHYCYEEFARGTMQEPVRQGVRKLIESRLDTLTDLSISWFGGEPLYGMRAIEDLAPYFVGLVDQHGLRYRSSMTTNGYLLTPEVAERLLAWRVRRYQITLDGAPEDHDCSRPTRDGGGSFDRIFQNLLSLRKRPEEFEVVIRVNWDKSTYERMGNLLDLLEREFRDDERFVTRFHTVFSTERAQEADLDLCGRDEATELSNRLKHEMKRRGLAVHSEIRGVQARSSVCYAARPYHFVIGASGKVMKCTVDLDMKDRNIVGQLDPDGELNLDHDKMAAWCNPAFETDTKCQKCTVLPVCMGMSCPIVRMDTGNSPCIPLRTNMKEELRLEVETFGDKVRSRTLGKPRSASEAGATT